MGYNIEVTERANRQWHVDNLQYCERSVKRIIKENDERLSMALDDYKEAVEWAAQECPEVLFNIYE